MKDKKHIHLTAICGMGMGAFAGLLCEAGYRITGSDQNVYPPMSTYLENMGIELMSPFSAGNLREKPDMVVVGNAVRRDNPEMDGVRDMKIPYQSFPAALKEYFLKGKKPLVVAGTHGKTTTSAMLSWTLESAGLDPGFLVGGILKNFDSSYKLGRGEFFVVEGDEYDTAFFDKGPKFMHYMPFGAILTSVEFDHGDIYKDIGQIKKAFENFVGLIPRDGFLIACGDYENVSEVISAACCRKETYGRSAGCDWTAAEISLGEKGGRFKALYRGKSVGDFEITMPGEHNILNALAVIALLVNHGVSAETVSRGLKTFSGVKRRQELRGTERGVDVIDDFAHHPTKVRETVKAIRSKYPSGRVWAIFEPRTNTSRRAFFQNEYVNSFDGADGVVIAGVFNSEQIDENDRFSPQRLVEDLIKRGKNAFYIPDADDIVAYVSDQVRSGDVILVMSNGGFHSIHEKILDSLKKTAV